MGTEAYFYIVTPDAPEDVRHHDPDWSPYVQTEFIRLSDAVENFEAWARLGIEVLFYRDRDTELMGDSIRGLTHIGNPLSYPIPAGADEQMREWMDAYYTDVPASQYEWWKYDGFKREDIPSEDTPGYRDTLLGFIKAAIGGRLLKRVY